MPFDSVPLKTNPTYELLRTAHNLIRNRHHWCQGTAHRHAGFGYEEGWCALGALSHASILLGMSHPGRHKPYGMAHILLARAVGVVHNGGLHESISPVSNFNDSHDHPDVMALFIAAENLALTEEAPCAVR